MKDKRYLTICRFKGGRRQKDKDPMIGVRRVVDKSQWLEVIR